MSQAHARHAGARSAYRATRRVDTAGAWRTSNRRRPQASDTRHGYEPSPAPMAAYRSEYTRRHPQRRQARASYGGAGQYHRHRRYAVRTQSHAATTPVDRQRRDHTPSRYRVPGDRTRVPTARTSARHAAYARTGSPYHLHGGFVRRTVSRRTNPVRPTGAGRQVGTGATGGRRVFRGTAPTRYAAARAHAVPAQPAKVRVRRGTGLRDRLGHATTMMASNAAQAGIDRVDIADTMGHTAMELTARTSMSAGATAAHAVGHVAGRARAVMTRPKRAMVAAYKAEEKTARQLDRALRKGKPGAARAKRIADARKHAGKPLVLSDAKPSARIGGFAAKGKASRMIGKHVGGGLKKAGRGVKRIGTTGLDWMDEASARLTAADDDPASQLGAATRDLTFKAARKGVKGVNSSARFIWRHRRAPAKAVRGAKAVGTTGARVARAAVNLVRAAASRIAAGAASISLPIVPVIAALIAVLGVLLAVMGAFLGSSASESTGVANVPAEYEADVIRAGSICQVVTPSIIAAQIDQESNWNPKAGSSAGAQGIAQFMPSTWASAGKDGDGDGKADIWNPHDAIWSQGNYMCDLASQVETAKKSGRLAGDTLQLTLAAYNAGLGNVLKYGTIPPFTETTNYVKRIIDLARSKYTSSGGDDSGATVGTLSPKLVMSDSWHVNIEAMGLHYARFPDYDTYQCTWWAAMRRNQIGKPVDAHMGNGGQWNDTAARLGYKVGRSPKPGDVICFEPGVHGSSGHYGHVAVVEQVNSDGSILISQSGTGWMAVVTQTISSAQLKANAGGVSFIH